MQPPPPPPMWPSPPPPGALPTTSPVSRLPSKRVLIVCGVVLTVVGLAGLAVWLRPATWDPAVEPYVAFVEESRDSSSIIR